ncbi:chitoporin ChiP [Yersinia enterocolitica]|uniref:chitoporin ChiP n=1 Tax=Yersinia enterocolitica TaxID=630 RepID=UPI000327EBE0|nr:OprD family outer membrane porin [Yersinia enterocolitica]CCV60839.1 putative exported protein [Yersinia enterocolitica (type O:2) str. YE3094/96]CNE01486.1 OprD family outer membrane porin [Yersinia enterocolitica]
MVTHGAKRKTLALAVAGALLGTGFMAAPEAKAEGFVDDSSLTGGIYYWQRQRDRKDLTPGSAEYGKYVANLHHSTFNANLDFSSGYAADMFGIDLAAFGAVEMTNSGPAAPNEIGFSDAKTRWDEKWTGDKSGVSIYKAAAKFKLDDFWARGGYIQPTGQTLLAPHWSFMPGTYRGAEGGAKFDFDTAGALSMSYMWTDEYKAPWYQNMYNFRQADGKTGISYLHSIGAKYDFKNKLVLEAAFGQAKDYMDQYFAKASYAFPVAGNDLRTSYQFYGAKDKVDGGFKDVNDVYDGLAWLQALTLGYTTGPFDLRLEGTWARADGNQGYFLQRMTPGYATSNGRLDVWWDSRSDFNANGEKALFGGVMYDLKNWNLAGWAVGTSYAYGWDAKPSTNPIYDQNVRLKESAWNFDVLYTLQEGRAKGTLFKLHYTMYDNHTNIPSFGGGFGNVFQDEKDVKFIVIAPFTIF